MFSEIAVVFRSWGCLLLVFLLSFAVVRGQADQQDNAQPATGLTDSSAYKVIQADLRQLDREARHQEIIAYVDSVLAGGGISHFTELKLLVRKAYSLLESGNYSEALELNQYILNEATTNGYSSIQFQATRRMGFCYQYAGLYDKATEWQLRALALARKSATKSELLHALESAGKALSRAERYDEARSVYSNILTILAGDLENDYYAFAICGLIRSYQFEGQARHPEALAYLRTAENLVNRPEPYKYVQTRRNLLSTLSYYYLDQEEYEQSLFFARKHLDHVSANAPDTSELVRFALQELYPVEAAAGEHEAAYATLLRYHGISEAMRNRSQAAALARTSVELDLDKHEAARLAAESAALVQQQEKTARTRLFIIFFLAALLVLGGVLYAYQRVRRDRKLISAKNRQIEQSLSEKEVLLREIHHRVKNNLQIISSLLQSQADMADNEKLSQLVSEGQERIHSMALIHQNLYQSEHLGGVNIKSYLGELTNNIQRGHAGDASTINLELRVADEQLDIDTAIPVGLILNELITNAYKYAFPGGKAGSIIVEFSKVAERFLLRVSDNGIGLPTDGELRKSNSLGINLVNGLVRQLEGNINWEKAAPGTSVAIEF